MSAGARPLRSRRWLAEHDLPGFLHRATLRSIGLSRHVLDGRPIVGICNPWSELVNCNVHFHGIAAAVRRGVVEAGGLPLEFGSIPLGENLMKPTTMLYRNLMAMDVEETIRAYPFDSVVLLGGCDKTIPAHLMAAASANVPALLVGGGPAEPAVVGGRELSVGTDLWRTTDDMRAGRLDEDAYFELEGAWIASAGHCNEMGTASTMAILAEVLGMMLPGTATVRATGARRLQVAEESGRRAVELARSGPDPRTILSSAALANAVTALVAIGGSTNAIVHLLALARRSGAQLELDDFDRIARTTPRLVDVRPAGTQLVHAFEDAGGVRSLLRALGTLIDTSTLTVTGAPLAAGLTGLGPSDGSVISTLDTPFGARGGLAVVRGSLAPDGAVIKRSAASERLLRHRGRAVVFESVEDVARRIDDPALGITPDSVLILRHAGPKGGPGMPEWGMLPIPERLLRAGVSDMLRVSDARMSGTAFGSCVLHVAPEASEGGPLALVRDGDPIVLDIDERRIDIDVDAAELDHRRRDLPPRRPAASRGYIALHLAHVLQANHGCDLDLLGGPSPDEDAEQLPAGLFSGWVGGW